MSLGNSLNVSVFPNPFQNQVHIHIVDEVDSEVEIKVHDLMGRLVFHQLYEDVQKLTIQLPNVSSGSYVISVASENRLFTSHIQKLK